jgi:hypothetical protein
MRAICAKFDWRPFRNSRWPPLSSHLILLLLMLLMDSLCPKIYSLTENVFRFEGYNQRYVNIGLSMTATRKIPNGRHAKKKNVQNSFSYLVHYDVSKII